MKITLDRPWLTLDLGAEHRVLSWALNRPGFTQTRHILWREVRNADLTPDLDVTEWLESALAEYGHSDAVALLTSRDIRAFETAEATVDGHTAFCVATVGLSNGERVGTRLDRSGKDWGTINLTVHVNTPLSDAALLETLSLATQARTAAIIDTGYEIATGIVTGTGTDCVAVAAPAGDTPFAGMHTPLGHAVGRAVYDAVRQGGQVWMDTVRRPE